jgi:hypothetical protein
MTHQSDIPAMEHGMFFEQYVFDPVSNYTEEDLIHIVKFFNIVFEDGNAPPHPRHFENNVFVPKEGITAIEFADILHATKQTVSDDIIQKLPARLQTHFDGGKFIPFDDFGFDDLTEYLTKFVNFRLGTEQFNTLSKKMKRQFLVFTRDGKTWRFGDRAPSH